jgi:hypothetical protein
MIYVKLKKKDKGSWGLFNFWLDYLQLSNNVFWNQTASSEVTVEVQYSKYVTINIVPSQQYIAMFSHCLVLFILLICRLPPMTAKPPARKVPQPLSKVRQTSSKRIELPHEQPLEFSVFDSIHLPVPSCSSCKLETPTQQRRARLRSGWG